MGCQRLQAQSNLLVTFGQVCAKHKHPTPFQNPDPLAHSAKGAVKVLPLRNARTSSIKSSINLELAPGPASLASAVLLKKSDENDLVLEGVAT